MSHAHAGTDPTELVHYDVAGAVATITLDSPANRNALSKQLVTELFGHLERAGADDGVRVVLVQSSGRVFCSGADLAEASTEGMEVGARRIVYLQRLIATLDKPVVTKNLGAVRAGGIGIIAAADIAVSADDDGRVEAEALEARTVTAHEQQPGAANGQLSRHQRPQHA